MKTHFMMKNLMVIALALVFTGMLNLQGQIVGEAAPDFEVELLGGETFKLSEQQGKVVFMFMFGNGCPPCRSVAPTIESTIFQEFKDDASFTAIGLDTWNSSSSVTTVTAFKNLTGVTFPLAIMAGSVENDYNTDYDRMLVVDQNGILVHKGASGAKNDLDNVVDVISQSLMTTGLEAADKAQSKLRVYPVPATDVVHFESEESIRGIRMYDVAGKLVLEESYGPGNGTFIKAISTVDFGKGIFFYTLQTDGSAITGKLLIQQ